MRANKKFVEFKDREFPSFMREFKKECVLDVIKEVTNITTQVVTVEMLEESLNLER